MKTCKVNEVLGDEITLPWIFDMTFSSQKYMEKHRFYHYLLPFTNGLLLVSALVLNSVLKLFINFEIAVKVVYKTVNPTWNQTFEFPDDGSPLELQVRDHNAILSSSSIGNCTVEYQRLPPNELSDKWIPLQGVKKGEIHVQVIRRVPDQQKRPSLDSDSLSNRAHAISDQVGITLLTVTFFDLCLPCMLPVISRLSVD